MTPAESQAPCPAPPACPRCGGARSVVRKSSSAVMPLFVVGLVLLVGVGLLLGEPAGALGLVVILAAGIIEATTRKRWIICRACDTAEPAPPRASDL